MGSETISKISSVYSELNTEWLLTGNGKMLKSEELDYTSEEWEKIHNVNYRMIPVWNFDAVGSMEKFNEITDYPEYIEKYIPFPDAKKGDMCIHVTGSSMIPKFNPGSLLLIRRVENWKEFFGYDDYFILILNDGRRILKQVSRSKEDPKTYILCVSKNPEGTEEELPRDMINDVYKVIMSFTNEGY